MEYQSGGSGSSNSQSKKKRHRYPHTSNQIQRLEEMYMECPHPDEKQKLELSKELSMSHSQIRFWFQNKRTQMKTKHERTDNSLLRAENDKIRCENIAMKEALENLICPSCGCPPNNDDCYFDEQKLRLENAQLKEELHRESSIVGQYSGRSALALLLPPTILSSLASTMGNFSGQGLGKVTYMEKSKQSLIGEKSHSPLLCPKGKGELLNPLSLSSGHTLLNSQLPQRSWTPMYGNMHVNSFGNAISHEQYSGKDSAIMHNYCDSNAQNQTLSGINIDSSGLLLPTTIPGYTNSSAETGAPTMELGFSGVQGSDGPSESFLNSTWNNEILSPEDIQAVETFALGSGKRLNNTGESHHIVFGQPPSFGSLEY